MKIAEGMAPPEARTSARHRMNVVIRKLRHQALPMRFVEGSEIGGTRRSIDPRSEHQMVASLREINARAWDFGYFLRQGCAVNIATQSRYRSRSNHGGGSVPGMPYGRVTRVAYGAEPRGRRREGLAGDPGSVSPKEL